MQYKNRIKILKETILYQGWSTLKQYTIEYIRSNRQVETQVREIFDSGDGVAVLLYNRITDKVLLIRQFRLPIFLNGHSSGFVLECCAGLLESQNPEKAIIREIEEETGYRLKEVFKIYEAFASPGAHKEKLHYYYAFYDDTIRVNSGGGLRSEQEDIEIDEYSLSQIPEMLLSGSIVDAKTITLLQWALLHKDIIKPVCK